MQQLDILIKNIEVTQTIGKTDRSVASICIDSRLASGNCLFVAIKGTVSDGHNFIEQVIGKGAIAIVCETLPSELKEGITYIKVKDALVDGTSSRK